MIADLIYDVGMNNGDDTAYYLRRGFRVVAIEAAPAPVQRAEERFRREIAAGRLTLLNVAIAETDGTRPFWICDAHSDWSSFDRAIAAREGVAHHPIAVTCRRFRSVLEEFGVPYYLKIDIEGSDHLCVDALTPDDTPKYLSLERGDGARTRLSRLAELGYTGFKCISQRHFIPLQRTASWEQAQYENLIRLRASRHPAARAFRRLAGRRMIGWLLNRTRRQGVQARSERTPRGGG